MTNINTIPDKNIIHVWSEMTVEERKQYFRSCYGNDYEKVIINALVKLLGGI